MAVGLAKPTLVLKPPAVALKTEPALPCNVKAEPAEPTVVTLAKLVISLFAPLAAAPRLVRAPVAVVAAVPPFARLSVPLK